MFRKIILIFAILIFANTVSYACRCGPARPLLEDFEQVKDVFTAKIVSVVKAAKKEWGLSVYSGANAVVLKVYKGRLKPGQRLFFKQGRVGECIVNWDKDSRGRELLIFQDIAGKKAPGIDYCGNRPQKEDLGYLENMDKLRGKTRISGGIGRGTVIGYGMPKEFLGIKVRLTGVGGSYETAIDQNGLYDMYDMPPGKYDLTINMPPGYAFDNYLIRYGSNVQTGPGITQELPWKSLPVTILPARHFRLDIVLKNYNPISVRVIGPDGEPLDKVCIGYPLKNTAPLAGHLRIECTKQDGIAKIHENEPGAYFLQIPPNGKPNPAQPYPPLFYPGTADPGKAEKVTVPVGGLKETLTFRIPEIYPTSYLEGTVTYADGSPVTTGRVDFVPAAAREGFDDSSNESTDKNGNFRLRVFRGVKGKMVVKTDVYVGEFAGCPETFKKLKREYRGHSDAFKITVASDILDVASDVKSISLKLPYTPCPREKGK